MTEEISFGKWLSNQRKLIGLTQKQLASMVNCATITLRKIEAEQRRPSSLLIKQLEQVFNIPEKEHTAFLGYARGNNQSQPFTSKKYYPWQLREASYNPGLLNSTLLHVMNEHNPSGVAGLYFAENLHQGNQGSISSDISKTGLPLIITRNKLPNNQDRVFLILLLPLEVPITLIQEVIGNPIENKISIEALFSFLNNYVNR